MIAVGNYMPILFDEDAEAYVNNGLGRLDFIECKVTHEIYGLGGGVWELEAKIDQNSKRFQELECGRQIYCYYEKSTDKQPFRIKSIEKNMDGTATVFATHRFYELGKVYTKSAISLTGTPSSVVAAIQSSANHSFTFETDVSDSITFVVSEPASILSLFSGDNGIIDQVGDGYFTFDGDSVSFSKDVGKDTGVSIRYGKNLSSVDYTEDIQDVVTSLVPFYKRGDGTVVFYEKYSSGQEDLYPYTCEASYNVTDKVDIYFKSETAENTWQPTQDQVNYVCGLYLTEGAYTPETNIKVSFIDLTDSEEYKDKAMLENICLGDMVTVQYAALGLKAKSRVVKTVYDVLQGTYDSIEIGTLSGTLSDAISSTISGSSDSSVKTDTGWIDKSGESATVRYRRSDSLVNVHIYSGGNVTLSSTLTVVTTLPQGFRPSHNFVSVSSWPTGVTGFIQADGTVQLTGDGSYWSIDATFIAD